MKIVGIAACTSGIAHTYIAKEKLVMAAKELGHEVHIETQGTIGTEDELTAKDIEAADVVLMDDEPSKLATAIRIAKKTLRIVRQNIVLALGIKLLVLILGALGQANMWEAVFADVGVAVIAILNASRMLKGAS